jgi:hypothetical protein
MQDPLRERPPPGRRKAGPRRPAGWLLQRTNPEQTSIPALSAVVLHFPARPQIGHNGGPLLTPDDPHESWRNYCWQRAHKAAWKTPPREIALRRLERAEALGITYREYTLEILERGRNL